MNYNNVLIDGDIIINKACFTCQKTWYDVCLDVEDRPIVETFAYKSEASAFVQGNDELVIVPNVTWSPLHVVTKIIDNLMESILENVQCTTYQAIVGPASGTVTFRHEIATTRPYKGNRLNKEKPKWYEDARAHMISKWSAVISEGLESDDMLSYLQTEYKDSILVSVDKDLNQVEGWHYNPDTKETYFVEYLGELQLFRKPNIKIWGTGFLWFCAQMLLGDDADNIQGLNGYGPVKVYNLLNGLDEKEAFQEVLNAYKLHERDPVENIYLLWILKNKDLDTKREELIRIANESK